MLEADVPYQNAMKNSDKENARIEHDHALKRVVQSLMNTDAQFFKEFSDNDSFRHWVTEMLFSQTYTPPSG